MKIDSFTLRGVHVLAGSGQLKLGSGDEELPDAFDRALQAGARAIVLDFSSLKWIDSAGIGAVVRCGKHGAERGALVKIVLGPEGPVRSIFSVTCLDRAFEVFDDLTSAVRSFRR